MRKYQKAAVVMAMLGSVSFLGAGVGHADDGGHKFKLDNKQHNECSANESHTTGAKVLGDIPVEVSVAGVGELDYSDKNWNNCTNNFKLGEGK